jgi:hypothetical protein
VTASVNVDIGGTSPTQFGKVTVTGAASLAGTLNANFVNGFSPNVGDNFQILTYASRTGTFTTVNAVNLPPGQTLNPVYNATNLTLATAMAGAGAAAQSLLISPDFVVDESELSQSKETGASASGDLSVVQISSSDESIAMTSVSAMDRATYNAYWLTAVARCHDGTQQMAKVTPLRGAIDEKQTSDLNLLAFLANKPTYSLDFSQYDGEAEDTPMVVALDDFIQEPVTAEAIDSVMAELCDCKAGLN